MTIDDYEAFCEIVIAFAELKGRKLSAPAIELYWRAMQHWTIEDFRAAAEHLLRTCEWMPLPSHFEALRKSSNPTAAEAWERVLEHCKGRYRDGSGVDDGGPIDRAVAGIGGYRAIAFHDSEKAHFLQREFAQRMRELEDVDAVRVALPHFAAEPARRPLGRDEEGLRRLSTALNAALPRRDNGGSP